MSDVETEIARHLSRMCPEDAGTQERMAAHWDAANRHAAAEVVKMIGNIRASSAQGRVCEAANVVAREGRRIRNEYLAKAV